MADPCPRCARPQFDLAGSGLQIGSCMGGVDQAPPEELLECRDAEIVLLRARLAAALQVVRSGVDVRARLRKVDGSGAATIYFSAALAELNQLLPEADRVLVGQEQHEQEAARRG